MIRQVSSVFNLGAGSMWSTSALAPKPDIPAKYAERLLLTLSGRR